MVISKSVPVLCGTAEWLPYLYGARRTREWLPYLYEAAHICAQSVRRGAYTSLLDLYGSTIREAGHL